VGRAQGSAQQLWTFRKKLSSRDSRERTLWVSVVDPRSLIPIQVIVHLPPTHVHDVCIVLFDLFASFQPLRRYFSHDSPPSGPVYFNRCWIGLASRDPLNVIKWLAELCCNDNQAHKLNLWICGNSVGPLVQYWKREVQAKESC
jgi:hypothetical protein